jgi:hypothetical protein
VLDIPGLITVRHFFEARSILLKFLEGKKRRRKEKEQNVERGTRNLKGSEERRKESEDQEKVDNILG